MDCARRTSSRAARTPRVAQWIVPTAAGGFLLPMRHAIFKLAAPLALLAAACAGPEVDPDAVCLLDDGAEVPCSWTCLTAAGSVVHCDDDKAARACYCSGPTGLTYPRDCSVGPVEDPR